MAEAAGVKIEFQRLHGMGEALYRAADTLRDGAVVRTYAPVGGHEDLLPYPVRRLLENGANTSFVHALLDESVPAEDVVVDPIVAVEKAGVGPHPKIPRPADIYGAERRNSAGVDLSIPEEAARLHHAARALAPLSAGPAGGDAQEVLSPSETGVVVGRVREASVAEIDAAFAAAKAAQGAWDALGGFRRAEVLRAMADALEANAERLIAICAREAGKTLADGVAEVREAVDFCRYYAHRPDQFAGPETLKGPVGETNSLELHGRGVFVCISPWNFPLAIFTGRGRGAGRGQRRARQAGRADAADRRPGGGAVP